ncbi:MAG: hypothetical protein HYZ53_00215, partial [Planctomycetes bacterium]|nr:hypothetical protein [Planctomycetota bacterium]
MEPLSSGPSILVTVNGVVLAYVLSRRPRTRIHRAAAVLATCVVLWAAAGIGCLVGERVDEWLRFGALAALLMPAGFAFFASALANEREAGRDRYLLPLAYLFGAGLYFVLDLEPVVQGALTPAWRVRPYHLTDPLFLLAGVYTTALWGYALFRLFALLPANPGQMERAPVRRSIISILAPSIIGLIVIPAFSSYPGAT